MLPEITIIGNLKKIETKFIPSGKQVTKFQVECSEKNAKGEWDNLYISGEVWDKSAEFVSKYFKDGSVAIVTGKLVTKSYDKKDGTKVYENKFLFPQVHFAPKEKSNDGYSAPNGVVTSTNPLLNFQQSFSRSLITAASLEM